MKHNKRKEPRINESLAYLDAKMEIEREEERQTKRGNRQHCTWSGCEAYIVAKDHWHCLAHSRAYYSPYIFGRNRQLTSALNNKEHLDWVA